MLMLFKVKQVEIIAVEHALQEVPSVSVPGPKKNCRRQDRQLNNNVGT